MEKRDKFKARTDNPVYCDICGLHATKHVGGYAGVFFCVPRGEITQGGADGPDPGKTGTPGVIYEAEDSQPGLYHPKNTYLEGIQLDGSCCRCDRQPEEHKADGSDNPRACPLRPKEDAHILLEMINKALVHPLLEMVNDAVVHQGPASEAMYGYLKAAGESVKALVEQLDAGAVAGRSGMPSPGTAYARANRLRLEIGSTESNLLRMREKAEDMEKTGADVKNARRSIAAFEIMLGDWKREYELNTLALRIYGKEGV